MARRSAQKVAVITGAARGIGRACAERLADDGFAIATIDVAPIRWRARRGRRRLVYRCDIRDEAGVAKTIRSIVADFGRIDVLVNNAGVYRESPIEATPRADIDHVLGINLIGTITMTTACVAALKKTRGAIVNLSTGLVARPYPTISLYVASKGAIEGYTRSLAVELAPAGVRANAVQPGLIRTDMFKTVGYTDDQIAAEIAKWNKLYPLGRVGEPADIAAAVAYLASDRAAWMTGVMWPVEGGKLIS
ncbi:MAG: SDR family oxidoreductase [Alphaproteobacteria bacterium]|nr:SDR family oxidoreductase [Alphaproteobacteria bacterium]